jgi:hypothetical protein
MSRNDIRLRRQRAAGASRFRNYGNVLERHEKEVRLKKLIRVFTYFAIILIVVMLLIIVSRTADRLEKESAPGTSLNNKEIRLRL